MTRVVVLGGGGHGHVVVEVLRATGQEVAGVLDPRPDPAPVLGVPVLGGDELLPQLVHRGITKVVVALGDNHRRRALFHRAVAAGLEPVNAIHPRAVIAPSATLGRGVVVMANAVVNTNCRIGDDVIVNTAATVDHHGQIGDHAHVGPGCHLAGRVTVGEATFLATGTVVVPGITIGAGVFVAAGSAIVRDVADGSRLGRTGPGPPVDAARPAPSGAAAPELPALILQRFAPPGTARLDESTPLVSSGWLDSFAVVELVAQLERTYGVTLRDEDVVPDNFETLSSIRRLLQRARPR